MISGILHSSLCPVLLFWSTPSETMENYRLVDSEMDSSHQHTLWAPLSCCQWRKNQHEHVQTRGQSHRNCKSEWVAVSLIGSFEGEKKKKKEIPVQDSNESWIFPDDESVEFMWVIMSEHQAENWHVLIVYLQL